MLPRSGPPSRWAETPEGGAHRRTHEAPCRAAVVRGALALLGGHWRLRTGAARPLAPQSAGTICPSPRASERRGQWPSPVFAGACGSVQSDYSAVRVQATAPSVLATSQDIVHGDPGASRNLGTTSSGTAVMLERGSQTLGQWSARRWGSDAG
eukprot:630228-Alexandrium_andersonii.AAC.2